MFVVGQKHIGLIDFSKKTLGTIAFTGEAAGECNILSFSNNGELIVVRNITTDNKNGIFFYSPESNFTTQTKALYAARM